MRFRARFRFAARDFDQSNSKSPGGLFVPLVTASQRKVFTMVFSNRLIRRGFLASAMAMGLLLSAPGSWLPQVTAQDSDAASKEPVLVMTLGSVNKLTQDINYVTGVAGQAQAGGMFGLLAGTFTQGLDMTRPIGMVVPMVNGMPQPLALLPTNDIKTVLKRLEAQTGPYDEEKDGTLRIIVGANVIHIQQKGDWAVMGTAKDVLALAPEDPTALFEGMGNDYDLAVRMKMQEIPADTRGILTTQLKMGFEQAMALQDGPDTEANRAAAENAIEQLEQLIEDTDQLQFGFNINQAKKKISVDGSYTAVAGSKLATMYDDTKAIPSQFASVIRDDAAAFLHQASSISPEAIADTKTSMDASMTALRSALDSQAGLSDSQREDINDLLDRLTELAVKSAAEGKSDLGALLLADEDGFKFVFGAFVADGNEVASIAKDVAAKVENEPGAPEFKFDISKYNGVTMHLVEAEIPASQDEARRMFGEKLRVHIGTGAQSMYLAFGKDSDKLMKELIDSGKKKTAADRPVGQMRMTMMPMLTYAQSIEPNDTIAAMIDALARSPDGGDMSFMAETIENGQKFSFEIGEGMLQAIGAAVQQNQQALPGGQF
ncbi:hypothetical protein N9B38_00485 [bacterium]|nr:hypothetical protein [bacterium]